MKDHDEDKRLNHFSTSNFLLVTGLSFLVFTGVMRLLDGVTVRILLMTGLISLGLGILGTLIKMVIRKIDAGRTGFDTDDNKGY
jgi:membrane protein required for beta-lactamase induction